MQNLRKFQRVINSSDEEGGALWRVDTPEKRLLVAILEQAFLDLYSYVKHGIIINRSDLRQLKARKKSRPTRTASAELIDFMFRTDKRKWSLYWILEHISDDIDAAIPLVHKARDLILARKFDCAVLLKDFSKMA